MVRAFVTLFLFFVFVNCSSTTDSNENHFGLPTKFPLEAGNAWVYKKQYFQIDKDSSELDTLCIFGQYQEYYKYSWRPNEHYFLVKNINDMLVSFGDIVISPFSDTSIYERPVVWSFFNEDTGYINGNNYKNYKLPFANIRIDKISNIEIFNNSYDGYIMSSIDTITNVAYYQEIIIKEGIYKRLLFNRINGTKTRETTMIQKLQNFYP